MDPAITTSPAAGVTQVVLGTRKSQLAIAQVDMIIGLLQAAAPGPEYKMQVVSTMADENQVKKFIEFNSKSIWTEELEQLLVGGTLDTVVHCVKDMPTQLVDRCNIAAICEREDPRDVVVMKSGSTHATLRDLPAGSVVGTSSVRRKAQIRRFFPHLRCEDVRGNVNTRLRKLDDAEGPYSCLVLAAAGLKRIDLEHRISHYLTAADGVLYAPGQGALALEIRDGDEKMHRVMGVLAHRTTTLECTAEKSLLRTLEGGCSAPIGVETEWKEEGQVLQLNASVISPDGKNIVEGSKTATVMSVEQADTLGRELAEEMFANGADKILEKVKADLLTSAKAVVAAKDGQNGTANGTHESVNPIVQ